MKYSLCLLLIFLTVPFIVSLKFLDEPNVEDVCFDIIKEKANNDACLGSRIDLKREKAQSAKNPKEFADSLNGIKCNGTYFSCGYTRSWVTEIFEGTNSEVQYKESKFDDGIDGSKAGYQKLTASEMVRLFTTQRHQNEKRYIYHMRFTGTEDHVWAIEQLPQGKGFRIYQSYNDAYSLKAWLSTNLDGLDRQGEIIQPDKLKAAINQFLKQLTDGKVTLANLKDLPAQLQPMIYFFEFVRDFEVKQAREFLVRAWANWGQGRILKWSEFQIYLESLQNLTEYFYTYDNTDVSFPQEMYMIWFDLFGSPTPVHFPYYPHNFITSMILPGRKFRLEVLSAELPAYPDCRKNAESVY